MLFPILFSVLIYKCKFYFIILIFFIILMKTCGVYYLYKIIITPKEIPRSKLKLTVKRKLYESLKSVKKKQKKTSNLNFLNITFFNFE